MRLYYREFQNGPEKLGEPLVIDTMSRRGIGVETFTFSRLYSKLWER